MPATLGRRSFLLGGVPALLLGLAGCSQAPAVPSAPTPSAASTPRPASSGASAPRPTPGAASTPATRSVPVPSSPLGWPATFARSAAIWSGPTADAERYSERAIGQAVHVKRIAGERAEIVEDGQPDKVAWVDIDALALSDEAWAALRPPRTATALGLALPGRNTVADTALARVRPLAAHVLESFASPGSPGLTLSVRSAFGTSTSHLDVAIAPLEIATCPTLGPTPPIYDRPARARWEEDRRIHEQCSRQAGVALASAESTARQGAASLKDLRLPETGNLAGALRQLAREQAQVRGSVPTRRIIALLNPAREPAPDALGESLDGIRVVLVTAAESHEEAASRAGEAGWRQAVARSGALSVRTMAATSPYLAQAFDGPRPVIVKQ